MSGPTETSLVYRIDADDCLSYFNPAWSDSVRALGAEALAPAHLLGRSLWLLFEDRTVRDLYIAVTARARRGWPARFLYRCDTATRFRTYEMKIRRVEARGVEFCSTLRHQHERPPVIFLQAGLARDDQRRLTMCSWCHAIELPAAFWVPIEQAAEMSGFLATDRLPHLHHSVCPTCRLMMVGKAKA